VIGCRLTSSCSGPSSDVAATPRVRHFIMHARRASKGSARPLNCDVRRTMITFGRNLLIALGAPLVVVLMSGVVQGAFDYALPTVSEHTIGSTNISTYALLVVLGTLFFLVGAHVPRWLRTEVALVWMLFPVVAVYLLAIFGQPYVYRCNPLNATYIVSCWVTLSPFVVSAVAVVMGYALVGRRMRSSGSAV